MPKLKGNQIRLTVERLEARRMLAVYSVSDVPHITDDIALPYVVNVGDTNHDGFDDILAWPENGFINRVFSGKDASRLLDIDIIGKVVAGAGIGDLDGDGTTDFVMGIPDRGPDTPGKVAAISGADGSIIWEAEGAADGSGSFGTSTSRIADVSGDGIPDVIVGAPTHRDQNDEFAGMARILSGTDGATVLSVIGPSPRLTFFGAAVTDVGDINDDAISDFAVGAYFDNSVAYSGGAIRFYSGADGSLLLEHFGTLGEQLGASLAYVGDVDGDGIGDLLAAGVDAAYTTGSARVISGANAETLVHVHGDRPGDSFGAAITAVGDWNEDGFPDFAVGASGRDFRQIGSQEQIFAVDGYVRVFSGKDGQIIDDIQAEGLPLDAFRIGFSLASANVDDDEAQELVIGGEKFAYVLGTRGTGDRQADVAFVAGNQLTLVRNVGPLQSLPVAAVEEILGVTNVPDWTDELVADFTGDGIDDILGRTAEGIWTLLDFQSDGAWQNWGAWSPIDWQDVNAGDFNGDGLTDILGRTPSGDWWLGANTGSRFETTFFGRWNVTHPWRDVLVADFDGNGTDDVAGRNQGVWWVGRSNGTRLANEVWARWSNTANWSDVSVGNFRGDALPDIAGRASDGSWWVAESTGNGFQTAFFARWTTASEWIDVMVADVDQDGFDDLTGRNATGQWVRTRATGSGFETIAWGMWDPTSTWSNVAIRDFTRDGLPDLIGRAESQGETQWWISENLGNTSFDSHVFSESTAPIAIYGDFASTYAAPALNASLASGSSVLSAAVSPIGPPRSTKRPSRFT